MSACLRVGCVFGKVPWACFFELLLRTIHFWSRKHGTLVSSLNIPLNSRKSFFEFYAQNHRREGRAMKGFYKLSDTILAFQPWSPLLFGRSGFVVGLANSSEFLRGDRVPCFTALKWRVFSECLHAYAWDVFLAKFREHVFWRHVLEFIHFRSRKHGTLAGQIQLDVSLEPDC